MVRSGTPDSSCCDLPQHRALIQPQQVRRAEDHTVTANAAHQRLASNAPCRIVNSPTNPFSSGNPPSSASRTRTPREVRHHVRQASVLLDLTRVAALVDYAHHQEQHARRDAMIDLLMMLPAIPFDSARRCPACRNPGGSRRVRHQLLPVLLHQAHQRAVDDATIDSTAITCTMVGSMAAFGSSGSEKRMKRRCHLQQHRRQDHRPAVGASVCASGSRCGTGTSAP